MVKEVKEQQTEVTEEELPPLSGEEKLEETSRNSNRGGSARRGEADRSRS